VSYVKYLPVQPTAATSRLEIGTLSAPFDAVILAPRHIPRLTATIGLFTRYGLREFARTQGLASLEQPEPTTDEPSDDESAEVSRHAVAFRKRLVELGPAYIKLGQILSTRPDLLPEPYIRELSHLQDDVDPIPFEQVAETIESELGARLSKLFDAFDEDPMASASLGQVHAATLRDGRSVVVKAQRPNIREQLNDDLAFFRELATFLSQHTSTGQRVDLVGIVHQVERALSEELDYRTEARNAASFRTTLAEFPHILIPRVIEAYTTARVLTTERVRGVKIDEIPAVSRIEHDFGALATEFARAYLKQITVDGHFHADPHPGNIFILLPGRENPSTPGELAAADRRSLPREPATRLGEAEQRAQAAASTLPRPDEPKLALIDFGMTAHLPVIMRDRIIRLLVDIAENRGDEAARTLIEIGEPLESFDRVSFTQEVAAIVAHHVNQSVGEMPAGRALYDMLNAAFRSGLRLPGELTLLAKAIFSLDAVTRALDPTFDPSATIRSYAMDIANKRARRDFSPARMLQIASETTTLVRDLPRRVDIITDRLASNDFGIRLDTPQMPNVLQGMQKIANRIFTGLVLSGLLVASGLLLPYWRKLGMAGFVIAAAIGLYMVITILISDRRPKGRGPT
jgi:ubiquinone biosynthesis protein